MESVRQDVARHPKGASGYVFETLIPSGRIVDVILRAAHTGAHQSGQINTLLRTLAWLPGREWVPPLLAFWKRHGSNPQALLAFLTALDRFAYGVRILSLGAEKRNQRMAAVTAMVAMANAAESASTLGPWAPLQFNRDELRNINHSLRDLHRRSPQVCRLVLQRLDEKMGKRPLPADITLTVEHILPLKVAPNSAWRKAFPDADQRSRLATCLGNLTLVTQAVNERAGNHEYARKCSIYFGPDGAPLSSLTAELRTISSWGPAEIEARLARMTETLAEIWNFDEA
jgi:hypothetical protein